MSASDGHGEASDLTLHLSVEDLTPDVADSKSVPLATDAEQHAKALIIPDGSGVINRSGRLTEFAQAKMFLADDPIRLKRLETAVSRMQWDENDMRIGMYALADDFEATYEEAAERVERASAMTREAIGEMTKSLESAADRAIERVEAATGTMGGQQLESYGAAFAKISRDVAEREIKSVAKAFSHPSYRWFTALVLLVAMVISYVGGSWVGRAQRDQALLTSSHASTSANVHAFVDAFLRR